MLLQLRDVLICEIFIKQHHHHINNNLYYDNEFVEYIYISFLVQVTF